MAGLGPYLAMRALPAALEPLREPVRGMLRDGWRPPAPPGPTQTDLIRAVREHQERQTSADPVAGRPREVAPAGPGA
jgi:hypothetical protein